MPEFKDRVSLATAEAYRNWYDLTDEEVISLLQAG